MKNISRDELDAYCAHLYGLTRDELRYTLRVDPKEVHGEDFPGETFRVLKEKEARLYGDAPQSDVKTGVGGVRCCQPTLKRTPALRAGASVNG